MWIGNFRLKVTAGGDEHLRAALTLAYGGECQPSKGELVATHFMVRPIALYPYDADPRRAKLVSAPALALLRDPYAKTEAMRELPFPLNAEKAVRFASDWLDGADRGAQPDMDGSVKSGAFTVYAGDCWRFGDDLRCALAVIVPRWAEYGK